MKSITQGRVLFYFHEFSDERPCRYYQSTVTFRLSHLQKRIYLHFTVMKKFLKMSDLWHLGLMLWNILSHLSSTTLSLPAEAFPRFLIAVDVSPPVEFECRAKSLHTFRSLPSNRIVAGEIMNFSVNFNRSTWRRYGPLTRKRKMTSADENVRISILKNVAYFW